MARKPVRVTVLIGCAAAVVRAATGRVTNFVIIQIVDLLRAIPPLALIVVTYFALPFVGLTMPGFVAAWLTLSLCLETAWRRPRAIRQALTLALIHKHLYEYVQDTSRRLEAVMRELEDSEPAT